MSPGAPSELSRDVLAGGHIIDGHFVPGGTQVGVASWPFYYNEDYFPDSRSFRPERWLEDQGPEFDISVEQVKLANESFSPFSLGPGNCVGKNLAWLEMMEVIGQLLYRLDIKRLLEIIWVEDHRRWGGVEKGEISIS